MVLKCSALIDMAPERLREAREGLAVAAAEWQVFSKKEQREL